MNVSFQVDALAVPGKTQSRAVESVSPRPVVNSPSPELIRGVASVESRLFHGHRFIERFDRVLESYCRLAEKEWKGVVAVQEFLMRELGKRIEARAEPEQTLRDKIQDLGEELRIVKRATQRLNSLKQNAIKRGKSFNAEQKKSGHVKLDQGLRDKLSEKGRSYRRILHELRITRAELEARQNETGSSPAIGWRAWLEMEASKIIGEIADHLVAVAQGRPLKGARRRPYLIFRGAVKDMAHRIFYLVVDNTGAKVKIVSLLTNSKFRSSQRRGQKDFVPDYRNSPYRHGHPNRTFS